ncbi:MAG: UDP-N-acetylmuramoylalanyl-D-glutamyl-2, 6-diaminopimelate--D-alanyl-D-alanine ligase, partial [Blastochloris sp.]|nr:UDP-N-acetylmuramoylalanyl-D-glutamyl-2, 6-diaminopimelate--D-alanyl-D-alanine ligase [Blastochloris sp.]
MLYLNEVLHGVQPEERRHEPLIPPALQQVTFTGAQIDSREVTPDSLFVALRGERVDGHSFLADAVRRGARGALVLRAQLGELSLDRPWAIIEPDGTG